MMTLYLICAIVGAPGSPGGARPGARCFGSRTADRWSGWSREASGGGLSADFVALAARVIVVWRGIDRQTR
jgi:hypothetical protein